MHELIVLVLESEAFSSNNSPQRQPNTSRLLLAQKPRRIRLPLSSGVRHSMETFYPNIIVGLITGIVSGIITGLYSGAIISRRNRFDSLRADLLRHVNSIEYIQEDGHVSTNPGTSHQVLFVASELAYFKHRRAATAALAGNKILISALGDAERGSLDVSGLAQQIDEARRLFKSASPSFKVYLPWARV